MMVVQRFRYSDRLTCKEAEGMSARLTFVATEEMKPLLARMKKEHFYDRTTSDMIRELVMAGLDALSDKAEKDEQCRRAC